MIPSVYVTGVGVWTAVFPDWAAWLAGAPGPALGAPSCAAVSARLLRGTSLVTRIALDVAMQALTSAGVSPDATPTVFGSHLGEIQTVVSLLQDIAADAPVSPLRFKNSVHNAASGNLSIALGNRAFSTALSAGADTPAVCLLEAWAWLDAEGRDVVVAVAEEPVPPPLDALEGSYDAFGVALCLSASPGRAPRARLTNLRRQEGDPSAVPVRSAGDDRRAPLLRLLDGIARREHATFALSDGSAGWAVDLNTPQAP